LGASKVKGSEIAPITACGDAPKAARNQEQRTLILECSHQKIGTGRF
jgi:hypothetical protein